MSKSKVKYYQIPASLMSAGLSPRAVLTYAVLAQRASITILNDKHGKYIICKISSLCEIMRIGERTAKYALAELEDAGLITKRKQGKNLPQKIYVNETNETEAKEITPPEAQAEVQEIAPPEVQEIAPPEVQKIAPPEVQKIAPPEVQKTAPLNNNSINNNSNLISSSSFSSSSQSIGTIEKIITIARDLNIHLSDRSVENVAEKVRTKGYQAKNFTSWLRSVIRNEKEKEKYTEPSYKSGYNVTEYEATGMLGPEWDPDWDDDDDDD